MKYLLSFIAAILATSAYALDLPKGWRLPTESELSDEPIRAESPTKYAQAQSDFNGDGKIDYAYLLKSTKFSGECLAVKISNSDSYKWEILSETNWGEEYPNVNLSMGVDIAEPDKYKTACGKGYWECEPGVPEELELKLPGIWYYRFESAASLWFWENKTKKFKQIWMSD